MAATRLISLQEDGMVSCTDVKSHHILREHPTDYGIYCMAVQPELEMIAIGTSNGTHLTDSVTFETIRTLKTNETTAVAFSNDQYFLATGGLN